MIDTPAGEVRNGIAAPAVTVTTENGPTPLDDVLTGLGGGGGDVTSENITDATTVGRAVLTAASTAAARTAIGAGTSSLALGTTAATAKAGDYVPTYADVTGKPATFPPTTGTTATTAAPGNHTHAGLLSGSAPAVADSAAVDVATLLANYNALLAALRARGVIGA